ncbi:hypothetical protein N7499_013103 [Penicillium canescens]|uniref:F-box domain-containing protein n=1 Tax=Penicillium canescens TaxID=5083 RepID=A0AAD6N5P7_PENCN|nr:uncharacterized protein N7446_000251 [Penicillium canescens]KAJ6011926.1 hypothetical protein N7522_002281 [Penicillium canescens]KAJ6030685.1 hypothetical protein N7460_010951 [Penicillium canescens]KAJ6059599.1 hypothetical protein N7444_003238 [Penicillium canescens]KAJ6064423.1 hypothetical protein N7499_013103 [Penicillium canescens]KAJ6077315.1 hypothetical protein N7446_000251 [Penicillium canescens]
MNHSVTLDSLPNEVFVQILSGFSTKALLPLTSVCHRFHALVLRILHYRLLFSTPLKEYKLLLECFHPSSKLTEPHVFCKYLGTDGLSERHDGEGSLYENVDTAHQLSRVTGLYSRFRPEVCTPEEKNSTTGRNGARLVPSPGRMLLLSGVAGFIRADMNRGGDDDDGAVTREVMLDGFEDFSQLCVVANLVQVLPGTSLLLSALTIEDGVVRLWRDWLLRQSRKWKAAIERAREEGTEKVLIPPDSDEILWVDTEETVGLKMRVRPKEWNPSLPVLVHQDDRDEGSDVAYEVDLEELHIRSTRLLLAAEQSKEEQQNYQPNAVVLGNAPIAAPIQVA